MIGAFRRRAPARHRIEKPLKLDVINLFTDIEFYERFRMSKSSMRRLISIVELKLKWSNERNYPKPVDVQVLTAIRVFRGEPTVSRVVSKVAEAFAGQLKHIIKFPSEEEFIEIKTGIYKIAKFPSVFGAIYGTHFEIKVEGDIEKYRNRKGKLTINVQAIVDHKMKFRNFVRWPGSTHDNRIFKNSRIFKVFENNFVDGILLGDNGYACVRYLLTPILNPKPGPEERYNNAHTSTRNLDERTFVEWKKKFNILNIRMQTKLRNSLNIIMTCGVIWNLLIEF